MNTIQTTVKNHTTDRILHLKTMDGKKTISSTGLVDPRLFNGSNELHLFRDSITMLWKFRYKIGGLPGPLQQSFTKFTYAYNHAVTYLAKRNIEITHVEDVQ